MAGKRKVMSITEKKKILSNYDALEKVGLLIGWMLFVQFICFSFVEHSTVS